MLCGCEDAEMLRELGVAEQRYRAVLEVLDGASVTEVARRFGVKRTGFSGGWVLPSAGLQMVWL